MTDRLGPYLLGPNDDKNNGIYTGDARELAEAIPDESVDLIFTDPVYQNIDDYRWLAETAVRVLRPNSACLTFTPNRYMPAIIQAMSPLHYVKTLAYHVIKMINGIPMHRRDDRSSTAWTPCLWMEKGYTEAKGRMFDILITQWGNGVTHKWMKDMKVAEWVEPLTKAGNIVLDPFAGSGTMPAVCKMLGRRYLAFEIDPDTAERARERVRNTQPPLFVLEAEQLALEV